MKVSAIVISHGHAAELAHSLPVLAPQVDEVLLIANIPGSVPRELPGRQPSLVPIQEPHRHYRQPELQHYHGHKRKQRDQQHVPPAPNRILDGRRIGRRRDRYQRLDRDRLCFKLRIVGR